MNRDSDQYHLILIAIIALTVLLAVASCGKRTPTAVPPTSTFTAQPGILPTTTHTNTPRPGETQTPPAVVVVETTARNTFPGITATASSSDTPTLCIPPAGWIVYTILPGDTLFSLAKNTDSTVQEIQKANCLTSDLIKAYDQIHLRKRPPAPPPAPAPQQTSVNECASIFSCSNPVLDPLVLTPGGGNIPTYKPCQDGNPAPHITHEGLAERPPSTRRQIGQQTYFFACNFTNPANLTAQISGQGGGENLEVLEINDLPNRDLISNSQAAVRVAPWYPVCSLQADVDYTITMSDGFDQESLTVTLVQPPFQRIMVKPQTIRAGETFEIYYCGYSSVANQQVEIGMFYLVGTRPDGTLDYNHYRSWDVLINRDGWVVQRQTAPSNLPELAYYLQDNLGTLDGEDFFWVIP